jgi:hypothetical protein
MRTQFGLQERWSCTGIGVVVRVLSHVVTNKSNDFNNNNNNRIASDCVRLLHLVLWHVRRQRERCENNSTESSKPGEHVSFRSLLVEYAEFHRSACNLMLANDNVSEDVRRLVAMQLQEIAEDEEEMEDIRRQMAATKK